MKALLLLPLLSLGSLVAEAAPPPRKFNETTCYTTLMDILKRDYTKYRIEKEGGEEKKIGYAFVDAEDFMALPTTKLLGMDGDQYFGLVGYMRVNYMGDATSHLYTHIVSATCYVDAGGKDAKLSDVNQDGKLDKEDIKLQDIDFDRS